MGSAHSTVQSYGRGRSDRSPVDDMIRTWRLALAGQWVTTHDPRIHEESLIQKLLDDIPCAKNRSDATEQNSQESGIGGEQSHRQVLLDVACGGALNDEARRWMAGFGFWPRSLHNSRDCRQKKAAPAAETTV